MLLNLCATVEYPSGVVNFAAGVTFMGSFPFLVTTFLLFISIILSPVTAHVVPKTIFVSIYAFVLSENSC